MPLLPNKRKNEEAGHEEKPVGLSFKFSNIAKMESRMVRIAHARTFLATKANRVQLYLQSSPFSL